ncbi:hypothetical protein [Kribbella deserti]|uniref:N-acetyltransferase domain-containing protein n=1 Tax=Kribbella deserti TaxID=1926257 RepID=A0ABV6QSC1_9ACTN
MHREIREVAAGAGWRRFEGAGGSVELRSAGFDRAVRLQVDAEDPGIWISLLEYGVQQARADGMNLAVSVVREDDVAADRLEGAGYTVRWRSWGAELVLPDDPDWSAYDALIPSEVEIRELAPGDAEAAYEMYVRAAGDFPRTPATVHETQSAAEFAAMVREQRVFGAIANGRWLGITVSTLKGREVDTFITATDPEWRGQGLAAAIKVVMIRTLFAEGGRVFRTGGAEVNLPMLAVNAKLGYVREPWWLTFGKEI